MAKTVRLSADQREDLVAYLDGELPDGKAEQIDQVLARSEVARFEVEALARTWEMLDVLPTPKAPPEFTERTMTTLKVAEVPFDITEQPWFKPLKQLAIVAIWMTALGLSGWFGFRITNEWVGNSSRQMLEDLPTLQRLDLYQEVETTDFLDKLQKGRLFDDVPEAGWIVHHDHWRQGIAGEAMRAILAWFDRVHGAQRIGCMIEAGNTASEKLAATLGFAEYDREAEEDGRTLVLYQREA